MTETDKEGGEKKFTSRARGRKQFQPTDMDRAIVSLMAGAEYAHEGICHRIWHNGKPITRPTLLKYFMTELTTGRAIIDTKVMTKLLEAIDQGKQWAIETYIEKKMWRPERGGFRNAPTQNEHLVGHAGNPYAGTAQLTDGASDPTLQL